MILDIGEYYKLTEDKRVNIYLIAAMAQLARIYTNEKDCKNCPLAPICK